MYYQNKLFLIIQNYCTNATITVFQDVEHFYNELPFKIGMYKVEDPKFNHFDFVWGADASKLVYNKVLDLLNAYNN